MTPELYRQIGELYHAALEVEPNQRAAFLESACAGDDELRREVESLIASHEMTANFIDAPALAHAAAMLAESESSALTGQTIARYRVGSLVGAGGMGRVYLAEDMELGRRVALKILPQHFTHDETRVQRFRQEARAASALNHPNIVTIYEIGQTGSEHFIATEFIDGQTLRAQTAHKSMSIDEVLDVAMQVVSALQAAHEAGIVHRDIKPENIMLRRDGIAKVLDFGLAKLALAEESTVRTTPGIVMGTAAYMSPEQARGQEVDARTDLWSLGVVLYEMLTGRSPFAGETVSDVIAAILKTEPVPLAPEAPEELQRIVRKCLDKNREERYQSAKDLLEDLRRLRETGTRHKVLLSRRNAAIVLGFGLLAAVTATIYLARPLTVGSRKVNALAVLPFVNTDRGSQHLSDGLTEEVIDRLSQLPELRVMARTTVFTYKGQPINPRRAGSELNVPAVLVGTFRPDGNRYVINAELVDVRDGSQIWGDRYAGRTADLVEIQNRIVEGVSRRLRPSLTNEQRRQMAQRSTGNPEAYELYLRGLQSASVWTMASLQKAIWYYRQAISRDSSFAPAYAGLAEAYSLIDHQQDSAPTIRPTEVYEGAIEAARKALELDGNSVEAHAALGHIFVHQGRFEEAERHIRRALELNPNSVLAGQWYAVLMGALGRTDEAVDRIKRTREIDPMSVPLNWVTAHIFFYYAGDLDNAIKAARRVIEIAPDFPQAYYVLAQAYALKGEYAEAQKFVDEGARLRNPRSEVDEERALVLALSDRRAEALALLDRISREKEHPSPRWMAFAYSALGESDKAVEWFQRFARENPNFARMAVALPPCPKCAGVRVDPRYLAVRKELGLPN